ncbi:DUF6361 family protein [Pseudoxanthomonas sp.]|uniref:DUF6361 family protein n=1 Tax=Pseudoxanthomonas sp. TaxID=1871049 RepID=UPI0035B1D411
MIGWILLSRQAVASAERALRNDQQGVRDEIGFLALHQGIADRLFPGTSVLHTRLRYALFVPWLMVQSGGRADRFRRDSLILTRQLAQWREPTGKVQEGIIGGSLQREPSQTAAMIYWSALARWGILQARTGRAPQTRAQVLRQIEAMEVGGSARKLSIDGEPTWSFDAHPFVTLPPPPVELAQPGKPIGFALTAKERAFLRRQLMAVPRADGQQSLLARLAEHQTSVASVAVPWHKALRRVADAQDQFVLMLAEQASALAGIGRGVYAALVEQAKNSDTGQRSRAYRDHLSVMCGEHGAVAQAMDLEALQTCVPGQPDALVQVLAATQDWLRSGQRDFTPLQEVYRRAEVERKRDRARLGVTLGARKRRAEWNTPQVPHPPAETLHYRWGKVRMLLNDLNEP